MHRFLQFSFSLVICVVALKTAAAQVPPPPPAQKTQDPGDALRLFAEGVQYEHENKLFEAMLAYEKAALLDPDALAIRKALATLYCAVGRQVDAAAQFEKVLKLDPNDHKMSYLYARLLREQSSYQEACAVLKKGLKSKALKDQPEFKVQMEYDLGLVYEQLDRPEDAAAAFAVAANLFDHPKGLLEEQCSPEELRVRSSEAHERVGKNYLAARNFKKASAAFKKAQTAYPAGAARLNFFLAQVAMRQGKLNEAVTWMDEYLKSLPQGTEAYQTMIGLLQKSRRDAEIIPMLEQATAKDPFQSALRFLLAQHYVKQGQFAKAEDVYVDLSAKEPNGDAYRRLFRLYQDHFPNASELVAQKIKDALQSGSPDTNGVRPAANDSRAARARAMIAALGDDNDLGGDVLPVIVDVAEHSTLPLETLQMCATLAERLNMLSEAALLYGQCIKLPLSVQTEPYIYSGLLKAQWLAHNYTAVAETCRMGLEETKACNKALLRAELARALAMVDRFADAMSEAETAAGEAEGTEKFTIQRMQVDILARAGKIDEAEEKCQALLKDHKGPSDELEIRYVLAGVYSSVNRHEDSEKQLLLCLKIDGDSIAINNDLGYQWTDQNKNLADAEKMIRKAIELDRKKRQGPMAIPPDGDREFHDNACYIDSLGWVLFRQGKLDEARKELEYASTLPDSNDPTIWEHLGDVYSALEQRDLAANAWRMALHFYEEAKDRRMDERRQKLRDKLHSQEVKEPPCQATPIGRPSSTKKEPLTPSAASSGAN